MAKNKQAKRKRRESNPQFAKPDKKWYSKMKILFFTFLALIIVRLIIFLGAEGENPVNLGGIIIRLLLISFGTIVAWWYVKKRD